MSTQDKQFPLNSRGRLPRRVLIPIDGTPLSERIVGAVRWLLSREETEVVLLAVVSPDEVHDEPDEGLEWTRDYLEWRRQLLAGGLARVHHVVRVGEPAAEIMSFADEYEPSVIAMATHGRTGLARLRRGSVTEEVLRGSRFPVLAANPACLDGIEKAPALRVRNVLVPLDGSSRAAEILPLVTEIAVLSGANVTLLHSIGEPLTGLEGAIVTPIEVDLLLDPFRSALAAAGVAVRVRSTAGLPGSAILDVARQVEADLIALTTHGRRGLARLIVGSVAEHVLRHSTCPVLVKRTVEAPSAIREPVHAGPDLGALPPPREL